MGFNSREEAAVPPGSRGMGAYFWASPLQHSSQVLQLLEHTVRNLISYK